MISAGRVGSLEKCWISQKSEHEWGVIIIKIIISSLVISFLSLLFFLFFLYGQIEWRLVASRQEAHSTCRNLRKHISAVYYSLAHRFSQGSERSKLKRPSATKDPPQRGGSVHCASGWRLDASRSGLEAISSSSVLAAKVRCTLASLV